MRVVKPEVEIVTQDDGIDVLRRLEKIGRICYQSEDKMTDDSYVNFIKNLIHRGHESVLEHYNVTVRFVVDRGVSHEIVRHRLASYSQESTRYCNYNDFKLGIVYSDLQNGLNLDVVCSKMPKQKIDQIYNEWLEANLDAEMHYNNLIEIGAPPQIARAVLNNSTKTELYMTANLREWRHFLKLRTAKASHPQMREIAIQLLCKFVHFIPVIFDDIVVDENAVDHIDNQLTMFNSWSDKESGQITIDEWMESIKDEQETC